MYLLDANTLIRANAQYYPIARIPQFWDWLILQGRAGVAKIPNEIADEITVGRDAVSTWLKEKDARDAMRLDESADVLLVRRVVSEGYAPNLNDAEFAKIGRDPFLIAYAMAGDGRTVVTNENRAPAKQRHNRKVPDVCETMGVRWLTAFGFYEEADFRI
ncbi:DUF4411 family protein [Aurantimonas sp. VKM B-3413]|uniref:DUF4411 family protein n=1 Tax=Aurantimonas sp. VKM B-3413 TaxID=2779401 RepID=UPI001E53C6DA|nr:DUF4411 family protein [Aurantimonas sp. VKM B-3413]MCB8839623.1 DUF4411 family protein [Aurantimonas sp. VKM B-3413]